MEEFGNEPPLEFDGVIAEQKQNHSSWKTSKPRPGPGYEPPCDLSKIYKQSPAFKMLDSPKYIEPTEVSRVGKRKLKQMRKEEREKTKGPGWYNMGAPELTTERKNDIEALRLRGALETKRFYKRNNITTQPKYFQVGRIVETPADYYSSRIPKKQRKQTLAEELAAEVE